MGLMLLPLLLPLAGPLPPSPASPLILMHPLTAAQGQTVQGVRLPSLAAVLQQAAVPWPPAPPPLVAEQLGLQQCQACKMVQQQGRLLGQGQLPSPPPQLPSRPSLPLDKGGQVQGEGAFLP